MATFKAEVYAHQKKEDGTYNIKIRVFHNGKKKYLATVWYVTKDDLTRSLKIKNQKYVDLTDELIRKYRSKLDRLGERLKQMSVEQVVDYITDEYNEKDYFDLDFVEYTRKYIQHLKDTGHAGTINGYRSGINSLIAYVGREQISIKEITRRFVQDWVFWLRDRPTLSKPKTGNRSPSLYFGCMCAMYNRAKIEFNDEDAGIIRIPFSPFKNIEVPPCEIPPKRALTIEQIRQIASLPYNDFIPSMGNNVHNLAKDMFLLSFALVGMNSADLYECTDYKDGRITYQRAKTRTTRADHAEISIRVEPEIQKLVDKYRDPDGKRVFVFYRMYPNAAKFNEGINRGMKYVGKEIDVPNLQYYAARHSWATIAANDAGVDKYSVHIALNHVDNALKITDVYIKKSWKPIDDANRKVLDLVSLNIENVDSFIRYK